MGRPKGSKNKPRDKNEQRTKSPKTPKRPSRKRLRRGAHAASVLTPLRRTDVVCIAALASPPEGFQDVVVDLANDPIPDGVGGLEDLVVDDGSQDEDYANSPAEPERSQSPKEKGDNWSPHVVSWIVRSLAVMSVLGTITCNQGDVNPGMHDELLQVLSGFPPEDISYWFLAYERGTLNQGGHLHYLIQGPIQVDKSGLTKISQWTRRVLDLSHQVVNGVKMIYKVHIKALLSSTQTPELTSAYLGKDIGQLHSRIAMGGPKANPDDFAQWVVKYRQVNADIFKNRVVLDWGMMTKHVQAFYTARIFPLAVTVLTVVWIMVCSGDSPLGGYVNSACLLYCPVRN